MALVMAVVDGQDAEATLLGAVPADRTTPALCGEASVVLLLRDPVLPKPAIGPEAFPAVANMAAIISRAWLAALRATLGVLGPRPSSVSLSA
jgi:hypothetical protein